MPVIQSLYTTGVPAAPNGTVTATVNAQSAEGLALTYSWAASAGWSTASGGTTTSVTITAPNSYGATGTATVTVMDTLSRTAVGTVALGTRNTPPPAPAAPGNVLAIGRAGEVSLSWTGVSGAYTYNIYWNTTGSVTSFDNAILNASMPYVHLGRTNGTTYYYRVTAVNSTGESALSSEVSARAAISFSQALQKLLAGDAQTGDWFGYSVSISGDYAIVGAYYEDGGSGNPLANAGAAYFY